MRDDYLDRRRDPRMNALPEWFTVEPQRGYLVDDGIHGAFGDACSGGAGDDDGPVGKNGK